MAFVGLDVRLAGPQRGPVEEGMICKRCTHFSSRARLHCKTVTLSASGRDATSALDPSLSEVRLWLPHERYAETLGAFLALDAQVGDVLLLNGDLGAGKTSLARGYIRCFIGNADSFITSPTYLLDNSYPDEGNSLLEDVTVHHIDLWRLDSSQSRQVADFDALYSNCVTLIEWPDRLTPPDMPKQHLDVFLEPYQDGRLARLVPTGKRWLAEIKRIKQAAVDSAEYPCGLLPPEAVMEG